MKRALITGISGQDGSYLAELLLAEDYEVHGVVRRVAFEAPEVRLSRLAGVLDRVKLHAGSMESYASLHAIVSEVRPDECYHLAAQSFVSYSFEDAFSTLQTNITGTHFVLGCLHSIVPECRFYFAGSSEMFGKVAESPQRESTPFHPRSPYGISKVAGFDLTRNYREAYGMHASSGILFNHESERRGHEFVTRKITSGVAAIAAGRMRKLRLGNLDALRDWGHAEDYVRAMRSMVAQPEADDYVVATGEMHSVRQFCELAFGLVGRDYREHVEVDPKFFRAADVHELCGNAVKAREKLRWAPRVKFSDLVCRMVHADCAAAGVGHLVKGL